MSAPAPTLNVVETEWPVGEYDRVWLFLDYGDGEYQAYRSRWAIGARGEDGLWLFSPLNFGTHENGLHLLPGEIELAKDAIKQIRRVCPMTPGQDSEGEK